MKIKSVKHKITDTKHFFFEETGETVKLEVSDTSIKLQWRISIGKHSTNWCSYYEGILTLASPIKKDFKYIYLTAYWTGNLPVGQVLLVKQSDNIF